MKHHYIPQFYLEPWIDRNSDNKLTEYRRVQYPRDPRPHLEIKRRGKRETGFQENLYRIPGATRETQHNIERVFMGMVDARAAQARDMMLLGDVPANPNVRMAWARFLLSLMLRNPEEVARFKATYTADLKTPDAVTQAKYEAMRESDDPETFEEWLEMVDPSYFERTSVVTLTKLIEHRNIINLIAKLRWDIIDTSSVTRRLMTSDRPVVMTNGLGQFEGHIAIPISPSKLFIAFMLHDYGAEFVKVRTGKLVRLCNEAIIGQARKLVYAVDGSFSADVKKMMGKREAPSFIRGVPLRGEELTPFEVRVRFGM